MAETSPQLRARRSRRKAGVAALLLAALTLRLYGLGAAPQPLATLDEYHYLWCGLSLMQDGRPTSWSWIEGRLMPDIAIGTAQIDGNTFPIVRPALDHPPLYSLLAGAWAKFEGAKPITLANANGPEMQLWRVDLARTRLLSLGLFVIAFLLLFDLTARRFGYSAAIATLAIYGSVSQIALHQRLLVTESLSTPMFLASLCAFERFRTGRWKESQFGAATVLLTAAALLAKLVAACQAGAILILLGLARKRRATIWPALGVVLGLGIYFGYAAWQGWGLFWRMMTLHGMRFEGFDSVVQMIVNGRLIHENNPNAPLLYGWLALAALAMMRGRGRELFLAPLIYLAGFIFFANSQVIFGWHLLPFYPFLAMGLGVLFARIVRKPETIAYLALACLLIPAAFQAAFVWHPEWVKAWRGIYLVFMAAALLLPLIPFGKGAGGRFGRNVQRAILILAMAAMLAGEARIVIVQSEAPAPAMHFLSTLK